MKASELIETLEKITKKHKKDFEVYLCSSPVVKEVDSYGKACHAYKNHLYFGLFGEEEVICIESTREIVRDES